ncbi:fumarylacetoacetate hydrolase family protein [Leifsonia sp. NPDC056665]|uniref:fumarylacetoacetate hydrolase family protein n=1 Tax=Leifsonia sp. NPDC056665 TaxID=3345901 RepID=UPI0036B3C970
MKFGRLGPVGNEIPVAVIDDRVLDLRSITSDIDGLFLAADPVRIVRRNRAVLPTLPGAGVMRIGAPIARPGAVYCIGMNYSAHVRESRSDPPQRIVVFMKSPSALCGPDDELVLPQGSSKVDWEVELGVVIGREAWQLASDADPGEHIVGYLAANDVSERHWQSEFSGGQWSLAKSAPGFLPLGPWLVPADSFDAHDARLRSFVNGDPRQDSRTSDMIFGVDRIIRDLSQFVRLEPGDVVLTGTPEGVALSGRFSYLQPGDVVVVRIDGLGEQTRTVRSAVEPRTSQCDPSAPSCAEPLTLPSNRHRQG